MLFTKYNFNLEINEVWTENHQLLGHIKNGKKKYHFFPAEKSGLKKRKANQKLILLSIIELDFLENQ